MDLFIDEILNLNLHSENKDVIENKQKFCYLLIPKNVATSFVASFKSSGEPVSSVS